MTNSREKGKRGEREFAAFLTERGISARRGQQFQGSADSPDIKLEDITDLHFEVKRVEALNIHNAMAQSINDSGGRTPLVAHRRNRGEWMVTMLAEDFIKLYKRDDS